MIVVILYNENTEAISQEHAKIGRTEKNNRVAELIAQKFVIVLRVCNVTEIKITFHISYVVYETQRETLLTQCREHNNREHDKNKNLTALSS